MSLLEAFQRIPADIVWTAVSLLAVIILWLAALALVPVLSDAGEKRRKVRWYRVNRARVDSAMSLESWELDLLTDGEIWDFIDVLTESRGCHPSAALAGKAQKKFKMLVGETDRRSMACTPPQTWRAIEPGTH